MANVLRPEREDYLAGETESILARNAIILSAISLCPLTALFVSLGLVINTRVAPMPPFTLNACLVYPLVGMAGPVREQIKQAELLAEKVEQDLLYAALQTLPGRDGRDAEPTGLARQNLQLYATAILELPSALPMKETIEALLAGCRTAVTPPEDAEDLL